MSKEGKGRNQIVYELGPQHIKVSSGSVSNILNEDKNNKTHITDSTINTKVDINTSASPFSARSGDGKVAITTSSEAQQSSSLHIVSTSDLKEIDFADTAYRDFYPYLEVDVNNISQKVINAPLDSTKPESEAIDGILSSKEIESQTKNSLFTERYESSRETLAGAWSYMHQRARKFKDKIRHENLLIDRRNKRLEEMNIRLRQKEQALFLKERDIVIREGKIMEAEPFLSLARRLQNTGLEFDAILPWIETLTEVVQMQRTDPRTAAQYIAYELSAFCKLGGL